MTPTDMDADALYGKIAFDETGQELGEIEAVYLNPASQAPEWVAVRTGRTETSLAPLTGASLTPDGVHLSVEEKLVRNAPHGGEDDRLLSELSEEQEAELYHYYAIEYTGRGEQPPL